MSVVEQFPYCDRNPASGGLDLMPDLPVLLRHQSHSLSGVGLVDSGASISVLPYSLGVQLGFDWNTQKAKIILAGTLAHVDARGIVVEAVVGQLSPVRLALAWAGRQGLAALDLASGNPRGGYVSPNGSSVWRPVCAINVSVPLAATL